MTDSKFISSLSKAYKHILFEQDVPSPAAPALSPPSVPPAPMGTAAPLPGMPATEKPASVEEPADTKPGAPLTQEGETMLAGLLAKAFFLDVADGSERYQIKNMQGNINDENAAQIELEIVKKMEALDPQLLDVDENLFELTPEGAKLFIKGLMDKKLIPDLEVKPGGGQSYLLNLVITALLRPTDLNIVKIEELLKDVKEKTEGKEKTGLEESTSKTALLFKQAFLKYAKV